jgi:hypothetical protein
MMKTTAWRVLVPVALMTLLALGILAALYAVTPRSGVITEFQAQVIDQPRLEAIDETAWQPYKPLTRMLRLKGGKQATYTVVRFKLPAPSSPEAPVAIFIPTYDNS